MYIGIVLVQDDGVVSVHFCPAFDAGDDGGLACNFGYFLDSANKFGADKAFVNKFISRLKPAFGKPLCHSSGSSRAAWGAIDGLVSIKYCISSLATWVDCFSGPKDMRQSSNAFLLWWTNPYFSFIFWRKLRAIEMSCSALKCSIPGKFSCGSMMQ